jgi:adenylate cyclase
MSLEIERKFLVLSDVYRALATRKERLVQGYLSRVPERTVRIRIQGERGFITIKGLSSEDGVSRYEWEKAIPLKEAQTLLALCEPGVIDKVRYWIPQGPHIYEVDEFRAENLGLVVAEIELGAVDESFERPDWLGEEVTGDSKYYNSALIEQPFSSW